MACRLLWGLMRGTMHSKFSLVSFSAIGIDSTDIMLCAILIISHVCYVEVNFSTTPCAATGFR